ncbi:MAG: hypothetical protein ACI80K_002866 [Paracoccaceae bacterium]|jgi:hypothetical protein
MSGSWRRWSGRPARGPNGTSELTDADFRPGKNAPSRASPKSSSGCSCSEESRLASVPSSPGRGGRRSCSGFRPDRSSTRRMRAITSRWTRATSPESRRPGISRRGSGTRSPARRPRSSPMEFPSRSNDLKAAAPGAGPRVGEGPSTGQPRRLEFPCAAANDSSSARADSGKSRPRRRNSPRSKRSSTTDRSR